MYQKAKVIIPAFNEEQSIGKVVRDVPKDIVDEVIVVSNGSTDDTEKNASEAGATVLTEIRKGYGAACLKGIEYLQNKPKSEQPDIVIFLDGDYSDYPEEIPILIKPITENGYDMVIGSRVLGERQKGALLPQQIFGNKLATTLMKLLFNAHYTDLGPFRAIKFKSLLDIKMEDQNFGWTVEMQLKVAKYGLKFTEVPISYRKRIGISKVTGTFYGTVMAGYKILWTIFKYLWK